MNGIDDLLVDTNIIIYYLKGERVAVDFLKKFQSKLSISVITKMELLSYPYDEHQDRIIRNFLNTSFHLININKDIIEKTIMMRRTKKIKLPDAIIAATAFVTNLKLVTRNISDFKNIGITVIDPFSDHI